MDLPDRFRGTLMGWAIGLGASTAKKGPIPTQVLITFSGTVERVVESRLADATVPLRDVASRFEALYSTDQSGLDAWSRLAFVPLFHTFEPEAAIEGAGELFAAAEWGMATVDTIRYLSGLIVGALKGTSKAALLTGAYAPIPGYWSRRPLVEEVADVVSGIPQRRRPLQGGRTPERCLEAALSAFYEADAFEEGYSIANRHELGLVRVMYSLLAGAYYGQDGIPGAWQDLVLNRGALVAFADDLLVMAESRRPRRVAG